MASRAAIIKKWKNIDIPGSFSNTSYFHRGLVRTGKSGGKTEKELKEALESNIVYQTSRTLKKTFPAGTTWLPTSRKHGKWT